MYSSPSIEFPGCPDSYTMTSAIMNLSIDYTITGGDAEIVEFTFENFDKNNGEDISSKNIYSSEEAAEFGIILPKSKNETVGIKTTFTALNSNQKRNLKLVVTATDSNGITGVGECEFIMNPDGETVQITTTTTTVVNQDNNSNDQDNNSNDVGEIPTGLFEISFLNKGFRWNGTFYTYPKTEEISTSSI